MRSETLDDTLWNEIVQAVHKDADHLFKTIGEAYNVLSDETKVFYFLSIKIFVFFKLEPRMLHLEYFCKQLRITIITTMTKSKSEVLDVVSTFSFELM